MILKVSNTTRMMMWLLCVGGQGMQDVQQQSCYFQRIATKGVGVSTVEVQLALSLTGIDSHPGLTLPCDSPT